MPDGRLKLILKDESTGEFVDVVATQPRRLAARRQARRRHRLGVRDRARDGRGARGRGRPRRRARPARERDRGLDRRRHEPRRGRRARRRRARAASTSGSTTPRGCSSGRSSRRPTRSGTALLGANLHGYFYGCRAAARRMLAQGTGGRIVNVTSAVNVLAVAGLSAYGAAKGAIASLTKALALELAPAGITVNAVAPGRDRHGAERATRTRRRCGARTSSGSRSAASGRPRRSPT